MQGAAGQSSKALTDSLNKNINEKKIKRPWFGIGHVVLFLFAFCAFTVTIVHLNPGLWDIVKRYPIVGASQIESLYSKESSDQAAAEPLERRQAEVVVNVDPVTTAAAATSISMSYNSHETVPDTASDSVVDDLTSSNIVVEPVTSNWFSSIIEIRFDSSSSTDELLIETSTENEGGNPTTTTDSFPSTSMQTNGDTSTNTLLTLSQHTTDVITDIETDTVETGEESAPQTTSTETSSQPSTHDSSQVTDETTAVDAFTTLSSFTLEESESTETEIEPTVTEAEETTTEFAASPTPSILVSPSNIPSNEPTIHPSNIPSNLPSTPPSPSPSFFQSSESTSSTDTEEDDFTTTSAVEESTTTLSTITGSSSEVESSQTTEPAHPTPSLSAPSQSVESSITSTPSPIASSSAQAPPSLSPSPSVFETSTMISLSSIYSSTLESSESTIEVTSTTYLISSSTPEASISPSGASPCASPTPSLLSSVSSESTSELTETIWETSSTSSSESSSMSSIVETESDTSSVYTSIHHPSASISVSPSSSASPSAPPSTTATPSPSVSSTPSPTASLSESPTASPTASSSESPTPSVSATPSETPSTSASPTQSVDPSPSVTPTASLSIGASPSATSEPSASASISPSVTPSPSMSESPSPTVSPSESPSATASVSESPTSSASPTESITASPSISESSTSTPSPSESPSESPSSTASASSSVSPSPSANPSVSPSSSPVACLDGYVYSEACNGCFPGYDPVDCDGLCPGETKTIYGVVKTYSDDKYEDCGGNCISPGEDPISAEDFCGVCEGDNSECTDCNGVVNGDSVLDYCGVCDGDNGACFAIGRLSPNAVPTNTTLDFSYFGASLVVSDLVTFVNDTLVDASYITGTSKSDRVSANLRGADFPVLDYDYYYTNYSTYMYNTNWTSWSTNHTLTVYRSDTVIRSHNMSEKVYINVLSGSSSAYSKWLSNQYIGFQGTKLFTLYTARCSFIGETGTVIQTNVIFPDSGDTSVSCLIPKFTVSQDVNVIVGYSDVIRPDLAINRIGSYTLQMWESPPRASSAIFTDSGALVLVNFDKATNGSKTAVACSTYFENVNRDTAGWIGTTIQDCSVSFPIPTQAQLAISARYSSSEAKAVAPARLLYVRSGILGVLGAKYSETASGFVVVQKPANPVKPVTLISVGRFLANCASASVSLGRSLNNGGRKWASITGSLEYLDSSGNVVSGGFSDSSLWAQLQTDFSGYLNQMQSTGVMKFSIPPGRLMVGDYKVTISLTNFLGETGTASAKFNKDASDLVPLVYINAPSKAKPDDGNRIEALAYPPCGTDPIPGTFLWKQKNDGSVKTIPTKYPRDKSVLYIPPNDLLPGETYTWTVSVIVNGRSFDYDYSLPTDYGTPTVLIQGGDATVSADKANTFKALATDTGYAGGTPPSGTFTYTWTLRTIGKAVVRNKDGSTFTSTTDSITIPSKFLFPGTYMLTVVATNTLSGYSDDYTAFITVVTGNPPRVTIVPSSDYASSADENFNLATVLDTSDVQLSTVSYKWISRSVCGSGTTYATMDLTTSLASSSTASAIRFKKGALTPGARYCFEAQVTAPNRPTGSGIFAFTVGFAPSNGYCEMTHDGNIALESVYSFQCVGWTTDSSAMPLKYAVVKVDGSSESSLATPTTDSSINVKLVEGSYTVKVNVIDKYGAVNGGVPMTFSVNVAASSLSTSAITERERTRLSHSGNLAEGLTSLSLLANSPKGNSRSRRDASSDSISSTSALLEDIFSSGAVLDKAMAAYIADLLQNMVADQTLPSQDTMLRIVKNALTVVSGAYNVSLETTVASNRLCYTADTTSKLLSVVQTVLTSMNQTNVVVEARNTLSQAISTVLTLNARCVDYNVKCDTSPFVYNSTDSLLSTSIGNVPITRNTAHSMCSFVVPQLGAALQSSISDPLACVRYTCVDAGVNTLAQNSSSVKLASLNTLIRSLTVRNSDGSSLDVNYTSAGVSSAVIRFLVPISSAAAAANVSLHTCLYYDTTAKDWKNDGCTSKGLNDDKSAVICECTHLTSFTSGLLPAYVAPSPQASTVANSASPVASASATPSLTLGASPSKTPSSSKSPESSVSPSPSKGAVVNVSPNPSPSVSQEAPVPTGPPTIVSTDIGGIIGGAVGGVVVALGGVMLFVYRKQITKGLKGQKATPVHPDGNVEDTQTNAAPDILLPSQKGTSERRDPALLPPYELPPTYEDHLRRTTVGENQEDGTGQDSSDAKDEILKQREIRRNQTSGSINDSLNTPAKINTTIVSSSTVTDDEEQQRKNKMEQLLHAQASSPIEGAPIEDDLVLVDGDQVVLDRATSQDTTPSDD